MPLLNRGSKCAARLSLASKDRERCDQARLRHCPHRYRNAD